MALNRLFSGLSITSTVLGRRTIYTGVVNFASKPTLVKPKPGYGKAYRRIVHFPEEYTVKPLEVTNLAGRDPETGRVVAKGIGGGIKHKFHWVSWIRDGPTEGPPQEEKVIQIIEDGCRTANVALVAVGDKLKYILATENMKAGDILKTSRHLPRIPVRANEGDAYLLGALPAGTFVHCIEKEPGNCVKMLLEKVYNVIKTMGATDRCLYSAVPCSGGFAVLAAVGTKQIGRGGLYIHAAGTFGTILRKQDDRIVVQMPSKRLFSFDQHCMAVVGRLSNIEHGSTPIGSPQRNRWLGNRPRSGLWHRKDGRHGRKIKPPKPVKEIYHPKGTKPVAIQLSMTHPKLV